MSLRPTWAAIFKTLGVLSLGLAGWLAIEDRSGSGTCLTIGVFLVTVGNLDLIAKFEILGVITATSRATKLVTGAEATLAHTRAVMVAFLKALKAQKAGAGRYGGMGKKMSDEIDGWMDTALRAARLTEAEIADVNAAEHPFIRFDYASYVTKEVSQNAWTNTQREAWNDFFGSNRRKGIGTEPSPEDLAAFLKANNFMNNDVEQRLDDYRHWERTKTHRRPDEWARYKQGE